MKISWKISDYVEPLSTYAGDIDWIFELVFWFVVFWTLLCFAAFFYLLWKYRERPGHSAQYVTGETKEEKRWITIPHMLVLVCDVFIIVGAVQVWYKVKQDKPPADRTIEVIAQQWGWTFIDPGPDNELGTADDIATVDDMYIEQHLDYHFKLQSRDVLHSFSVPIFRLKQDALPGREITGWFNATGKGGDLGGYLVEMDDGLGEHKVYDIQCAEMCGIGHGIMGARIHILDTEEYVTWQQHNKLATDQLASN